MAQYVPIEALWNTARFHCPVCGAEVLNEHGNPTDQPCEHLLFSWISEVGEFYNLDGELDVRVSDDEFPLSPCEDEFLERCPETAVVFGLKSTGMACGPVSLTVVHGIKFPEN